jgi:hypothetical protein
MAAAIRASRPESAGSIVKTLLRGCYFVLAASFFNVLQAEAQGGPPYFTNDPGTPGDRQWEINVGIIPLVAADRSTTRTPDLDLNYGVGDRIQLTFEIGWIRQVVAPMPAKYGLSQDEIGVKWRFYGSELDKAISIFPQVSINNPTDSVERGIVPPGASLTLPVEVTHHIGPVAVNGELGYVLVQSGANGWLAGVVAGHERRIRHRKSIIEVDAEFYATGDIGGGLTQETFEGGLRLAIHPPFVLLAMAGRSLHHSTGSFAGYVGLQFLLPPKPFDTP